MLITITEPVFRLQHKQELIKEQSLHTLINGCIKGDPLMQKSFYYDHYALLMRIAIRYAPSREDAEQWVHDGFLKIFTALPTYQYLGSFEGWMKKIMVRLCIDQLRTHNTQQYELTNNIIYDDTDLEDKGHYVDNDFIQKTGAEDLIRMINALPDKQKLVFNLVVFEGYSHPEISGLLKITENHSYLLLHQARKQLKSILHKQTEHQNSKV